MSTLHYYRLINEGISQKLGKQHAANLRISSLDFQPVIDAQVRGDWQSIAKSLSKELTHLESSGVQGYLIASNTIHFVQSEIHSLSDTKPPCLNIFDAVASKIKLSRCKQVGLMGTRYTMREAFFRDEYAKRNVNVLVPEGRDLGLVNEVIFKELIHGRITDKSKEQLLNACKALLDRGAEGVILGCTELSLLAEGWGFQEPAFDTTKIHSQAAVDWLV